jgi:hypothetical protein
MKFSTPSLSPRNSKNMADRFETEALRAFAQDPGLKEYYRRDTADGKAVMRYAQPVRLTEDCLFCHGDPVGAKDPFGYRKEGMKAGDIKGAFVVTAPLDELTKPPAPTAWLLLFISICTLLAAVGVVFMVVRRWVVRPITASTELARLIATNNLSAEDIEVVSGDEVGDAVAALKQHEKQPAQHGGKYCRYGGAHRQRGPRTGFDIIPAIGGGQHADGSHSAGGDRYARNVFHRELQVSNAARAGRRSRRKGY